MVTHEIRSPLKHNPLKLTVINKDIHALTHKNATRILYPTSIYMCRALEMAIFRKLPHSFYVNVIFVISGSFWHCNKLKTPCTWEHARMSCLFAFTSLFITHSFRWEGGILAFLQKCAGILNVFFPSHPSQIKMRIKKKNVQQTRYVLMHDRNTPPHWIYSQRRFYRFDPSIFRMCSCECVPLCVFNIPMART